MEDFNQIVNQISMTMGVAWASGINLYAAILMLGGLAMTGNLTLPPDLQVLASPLVMGSAGVMYVVEFFADKIPGVDTAWDTFHTFIRIPAGALLAMGAVGDVNSAVSIAAALAGGGLAAGTHATKAGTRVIVNASPEPFTNWTLSVGEDVAVIGGIWAALYHPWLFLVVLAFSIVLMIWALPKIWRGIKKVFRFILGLFGQRGDDSPEPQPPATS